MDINAIGGLPPTMKRQTASADGVVEFRPLGSGKADKDMTQEQQAYQKGALEQNKEQLEELVEDIQAATKVMQRNLKGLYLAARTG